MRLATLFEDLDDKDSFEINCTHCDNQNMVRGAVGKAAFEMIPDPEEFHAAHIAARQAALKVGQYSTEEYKNEYKSVMAKYGYRYHQRAGNPMWGTAYEPYWVKSSVVESLDDVDKFEFNCRLCKEQDVLISLNQGISADRPDPEEFHTIHSAAGQAASKFGAYGSPEYKSEFEDKMNWRGYYYVPSPHGSYWVKE